MHLASTLQRRSVQLIVTISALGCAEPVAVTGRPVAGCYRLEWAPLAGAAAPVAPLPDSVRLFDARGVSSLEAGRALVRAWPDSTRVQYRWSWWETARPDTLRVVFTNGYAGARLALQPSADGFAGTVAASSDIDPAPAVVGVARLRSLSCSPAGSI